MLGPLPQRGRAYSRRRVYSRRHLVASSSCWGPCPSEAVILPGTVVMPGPGSRPGERHGRRGVGAPRCGGGPTGVCSAAVPPKSARGEARPPWGWGPTLRRRADRRLFGGCAAEVGPGRGTAAVGLGPHVAEEGRPASVRRLCRRSRPGERHGRRSTRADLEHEPAGWKSLRLGLTTGSWTP